MIEIESLLFRRLIIHKIYSKNPDGQSSYCEPSRELHSLESDTMETLKHRIITAVNKSKKFFETNIEKFNDDSFFGIASNLPSQSVDEFIQGSISIGNLAAQFHNSRAIANGLLLVLDCSISNKNVIIVIKAEFQEAFTLSGNAISLIKDLFLSPGRELYKIGILSHDRGPFNQISSYKSYVYDDQFNSQTLDLAHYFCKDFLGFGTSKNARINTQKFYNSFVKFVDAYIDNVDSKINIKQRIRADYRESTSPLIAPSDYMDLFDDSLKEDFRNKVVSQFDSSFEKDTSLLDNSFKKDKIVLVADKAEIHIDPQFGKDNMKIYNTTSSNDREQLLVEIESGRTDKVVTLSSINRR